jgi:predicted RNA-binding Zn-ribbon protein involved in translation (DUF1610 family)
MWFFKTEAGTFCVRYLREGYGLFLGENLLSWHKDAATAAAKVFAGKTGHPPWDGQNTVERPKDLSEWKTFAEMQKGGPVTLVYDVVIVPLDCSCGHQLKESIGRIRTLSVFRCPQCKETIRIDADQLREIVESVKKEYPEGYIKSLSGR